MESSEDSQSTGLLYHFVAPESVRRVQRPYIKFFAEAGARTVLDLGSGRGVFLEMLQEEGIEAHGVDSSAEAVAGCREAGLEHVEQGDVLGYLDQAVAGERRFDGIFCSHLIEHMLPEQAEQMLEQSARLLSPGGRLVLVTPNVENLAVWSSTFWLDPTHVRPYPIALLGAMFERAGLTVVHSGADANTRMFKLHQLWELIPAALRYGFNVASGMDALVVGERPERRQ